MAEERWRMLGIYPFGEPPNRKAFPFCLHGTAEKLIKEISSTMKKEGCEITVMVLDRETSESR